MRWNEEYMSKEFPRDPKEAAIYICEIMLGYDFTPNSQDFFEDLLEDFAFLRVWLDVHGLEFPYPDVPNFLDLGRAEVIQYIRGKALLIKETFEKEIPQDVYNKAILNYTKVIQAYKVQLGVNFAYQLTEGDIKRIQELITKLRQEISTSQVLGEDHRRRLLNRLEKLQSELHKRMSDYDRVYGLLFDGVILFQKFGEAVKPITELLREIGKLFWMSQIRTEELPGDFPLPLPPAPKQPEDKKC